MLKNERESEIKMTTFGEHTGLEKVKLTSSDLTSSHIESIGKLFPQVLTEERDASGQLRRAIDFDKLKTLLTHDLSDGRETYEFTWVGKRDAMAEAGRPTTKTLRPDLDESVDFDKSENVFITGDNLEVLKLLQESYRNKVDMIYIDPPYNTGKDFVYSDKFQQSEDELDEALDLRDDRGRQSVRIEPNKKTSARYHSNWLNMMYPRLVLARNLLKETGVIFISIDDNEQANLKQLCDEVFGEENFVGEAIWKRKVFDNNDHLPALHEYITIYTKFGAENYNFNLLPRSEKQLSQYSLDDNDGKGKYKLEKLTAPTAGGRYSVATDFIIENPENGKQYRSNTGNWRFGKETIKEMISNNEINFESSLPRYKLYLNRVKDGVAPNSFWDELEKNLHAAKQIQELFDNKLFDTPKPIGLLKHIAYISTQKDSLILDFFAGSATTAHAVMQLNAEDGGHRKYILCTLDELVADKSAAKEAGYETIDQISRERIRRAAAKIQEEHPELVGKQDFGFKAYRLDSSNFKEVTQTPDSYQQQDLFESVSTIKEDRSDLDLLIQIMLGWGMELSLNIRSYDIEGCQVYDVDDASLVVCFADDISEIVIKQMAQKEPLRAVFRDDSFATSADKINLAQIFKELSPGTKVKVV